MTFLRAIDDKRGWLVAAVALAFILSTGILGFQLAVLPSSSTVPGTAVAVPGTAAPAPATVAPVAPPAPAPPVAPPRPPGQAAPGSAAQLAADAVGRLQARGFQASVRTSADDTDCVANSYGGTQGYLRAHPCTGLHRGLLDVHGGNGGSALVALAWVAMPEQSGAAGLKWLLDQPGSGNVTALDRNDAFTGQFYASALNGPVAVNADAHPSSGGFDDATLHTIVTAAAS